MTDSNTHEKHSLTLRGATGLALAADAWGDPTAPPVLLLHGGGQTRHAWAGTAQVLAQHGWYAIAMDLRGHGDSDWAPDGDYRHRAFAADTAAVADSFETRPVLVGASLGGISSLLALGEAQRAGRTESLARALVLVDIASRMEQSGAQRIVDFMSQKPEGFESLEEAAEAIASYNPHRPRPKRLDGLRKNLRLRDDGRYRWHWDPAFIEGRFDEYREVDLVDIRERLDEAAEGLVIPTLLVRGQQSDLLSEENARTFLAQVPHAKYVDVSGAGHMVAGDRNDKFTRAVVDFLDDEVVRPSGAAR
jgi:pimeloyl-ACP methyl ester carboxylesterase